MDSRTLERPASPDAAEFVRFCYRRRRVGWPELYDEMCAVANRGLYRGWGTDELSSAGIGFSLFELPALATLVAAIVAEEQERRLLARAAAAEALRAAPIVETTTPADLQPSPEFRTDRSTEVTVDAPPSLRFAGATAGA
jgi:hypothetical protein